VSKRLNNLLLLALKIGGRDPEPRNKSVSTSKKRPGNRFSSTASRKKALILA
jgi:hypothetical protein